MTLLMHDSRASLLSNRTIKALSFAGIRTWDNLVAEAGRTPNMIRRISKLGPKAVSEIIAVLNAARVPHTITTRGRRPASR